MASGPIPFAPNQESLSDPLVGASPVAINVVADSKGALRMRPGLVAHGSYTSSAISSDPVTSLVYTSRGELYAAARGAAASALYKVGGGALHIGGVPGIGNAVFADTESILAVTTGGYLYKVDYSTGILSLVGGTPPGCTHVVANTSRLLVNDAVNYRQQVYYSDFAAGSSYAGFETWFSGAAGYFSAGARPDPILALHEMGNEVYAFGTQTMQAFSPDPVLDYAPTTSRLFGCTAPYSIINLENRFAWLDDRVRFVMSDGRSWKDITGNLDLEGLTDPSECIGYRVLAGTYDVLCFAFPSNGVTYVYSLDSETWSQWSGYSTSTTSYTEFPVRSAVIRHGYGDTIVGTSDGKVLTLSRSAYTDLGTPIRADVQTGFVNRGTDQRKHCKAVRLAMRRGQTSSSTPPSVQISYRDDLGAWRTPIEVSLGSSGDTMPVVELRSLGIYRRRQWRVTYTGSEELVLVGATEEYDTLGV